MKVTVSGLLYTFVEDIKAEPIPWIPQRQGIKTKQRGKLVWVGLLARHSDLGSLAVHSEDADYKTLCPTRDGLHPLELKFQIKDGESQLIQMSDL